MSITVLHVDDDPEWREEIEKLLKNHGVEVISCGTLRQAKRLAHKASAFICDGSIHKYGDGDTWARKLDKEGLRVIVFSSTPYLGLPHVDKADYTEGGREELLAFVTSQE